MNVTHREREAHVTKEIVTVVMALGIGAIVERGVVDNLLNGGKTIEDVGLGPIVAAVGCILLILRFFQGNMRVLDLNAARLTDDAARALWASAIGAVIVEGILLSALGLFLKDPLNLLNIVTWCIFGDLVWQFLSNRGGGKELRRFHFMCAWVNLTTVIFVIALHELYNSGVVNSSATQGWFGLVMIAAFLADYSLNFDMYFPPERVRV